VLATPSDVFCRENAAKQAKKMLFLHATELFFCILLSGTKTKEIPNLDIIILGKKYK
jgi:hypothetical protein